MYFSINNNLSSHFQGFCFQFQDGYCLITFKKYQKFIKIAIFNKKPVFIKKDIFSDFSKKSCFFQKSIKTWIFIIGRSVSIIWRYA